MRILLLVEQCNPEWPSLPIVGYKAALAIAEVAEVVVVTQIRNKANIDKVGFGKAEVVYIDTEYVARPLGKISTFLRGSEGGWTTAMALGYPAYLAFEWEVYKRFKNDLDNGKFDIIHRLTPMSPTLPSYIAGKTKVPFIIGPLNGGLKWPRFFMKQLKQEREWLSMFRDVYKILPYSRSTYRNASAILAAFEHTMQQIPAAKQDVVFNFPEIGFDEALFEQPAERKLGAQKTVLFVGRLVPYKMPDVAVKAFIQNKNLQQHKLLIIGDGPMRAELEKMTADHGLQHCIEFLGWKTQKEVGEYMRSAEVFAFPSIRELGAGVVVEAMACGLVNMVVDYGAPGTLINAACGVRVPLTDEAGLVAAYGEELEKLLPDNERILELSRNAYQTALKFYSWPKKALKTMEVYDWVLNPSAKKPDFWG